VDRLEQSQDVGPIRQIASEVGDLGGLQGLRELGVDARDLAARDRLRGLFRRSVEEGIDRIGDALRGAFGDEERPAVEVEVGVESTRGALRGLVGPEVHPFEVAAQAMPEVPLAIGLRRLGGKRHVAQGDGVAARHPSIPAHAQAVDEERFGIDLAADGQRADQVVKEGQIDGMERNESLHRRASLPRLPGACAYDDRPAANT
jgi:hypothetical protein